MTSIFQQLDGLLLSLHGWSTFEKGVSLASYTLALNAETCLEVGTWGGKSAFPMLLALKHLGRGKLICVDPWKTEESAKGQTTELDKQWWGDVANHELVYQHFIYHLNKLGLQQFCEVRRMTSDQAEAPKSVCLLHVDGNHGPQALTDVQKFAPAVRQWGICVLDDLDWGGGYVRQAEKWLLENGFIMLHPLGTGAVYLRK